MKVWGTVWSRIQDVHTRHTPCSLFRLISLPIITPPIWHQPAWSIMADNSVSLQAVLSISISPSPIFYSLYLFFTPYLLSPCLNSLTQLSPAHKLYHFQNYLNRPPTLSWLFYFLFKLFNFLQYTFTPSPVHQISLTDLSSADSSLGFILYFLLHISTFC